MKEPNVTRALILAVSCLILGFVGGWTVANIGSDTVSLPDVSLDTTVTDTTATDTTGTGTAATGTGTTTTTAPAPVTRSDVTISVLNGSGVAGRAAETADQLRAKGWSDVVPGNTEVSAGTTIYYRQGAKEAADEVGVDLAVTQVAPLTGSSIEAEAATSADVVIVLGT